ncbi:30S ribosomal protein S17 [Patescibacteria group bacterium]|jgi:small subunit ribosomal protein S17|nr:30S ribosomal protein S17 [Patescibacteria group bacterium]
MSPETAQKKKRQLTGVVVSDKMQDTVVVAVTRYVKHPKYQKFQKLVKRYHAHDPGNAHQEGDRVTIEECAPVSKKKHFTVVAEPRESEAEKRGSASA